MKKVKDARETIAANRLDMSLMSNEHQQLLDRLSHLEADVEQKKKEYEQVRAVFVSSGSLDREEALKTIALQ